MAWDRHQRIAFEERAGILQFDGGLSRAEAERVAWRIIDGIEDVPEQMELVDDAGMRFFADMERKFR